MKKILVLTFVAGLFAACSNSNQKGQPASEQSNLPKIEISNDLENAIAIVPSWVGEKTVHPSKDPVPHSGEYISCTNDTAQYSYGFQEILKNIDTERLPKSVNVKVWINSTVANPKLGIILDISEKGKNMDWMVFPQDKTITETGKWIECSANFYFKKPLSPEQSVRIYAWNQTNKPIYFDDYLITFNY